MTQLRFGSVSCLRSTGTNDYTRYKAEENQAVVPVLCFLFLAAGLSHMPLLPLLLVTTKVQHPLLPKSNPSPCSSVWFPVLLTVITCFSPPWLASAVYPQGNSILHHPYHITELPNPSLAYSSTQSKPLPLNITVLHSNFHSLTSPSALISSSSTSYHAFLIAPLSPPSPFTSYLSHASLNIWNKLPTSCLASILPLFSIKSIV